MASNEMRVAPARGQLAATGQSMAMVQTPRMFLQGRRVHFSSNVWRMYSGILRWRRRHSRPGTQATRATIESRRWCVESLVVSGDGNRDCYRVCPSHESVNSFTERCTRHTNDGPSNLL
jgi:hypothetical protein